MDIIICAGFLGSGKTSFLVHLAHHLVRDKNIAIIENEIGKVGIDDQVIASEGLPVREIYSGCICCSLRLDLVSTLLELEREHSPDIVILEPSGVAGPPQVLSALEGYGGEIDKVIVVGLLDAKRFVKIFNFSAPIINGVVQVSDILLLNKCELVTPEELSDISTRLGETQTSAKVFETTCNGEETLDAPLKEICSLLSKKSGGHKESIDNENPLPPGAVACSCSLGNIKNSCEDKLREGMNVFLQKLSDMLKTSGCTLIGHVKIIIKAKGGYLLGSLTDFNEAPSLKGKLPSNKSALNITVNAIVFGVKKDMVEEFISVTLGEIFTRE